MITSYIVVLVSIAALASFLLVARFGFFRVRSEQEFSKRLIPIDVSIIENLYDPEQIAYVRSRLTHREFLQFERERSRVLIEYVRRISNNAALLVGLAHHLEGQGRVGLSEGLFAVALRVRLQCIWTLTVLH